MAHLSLMIRPATPHVKFNRELLGQGLALDYLHDNEPLIALILQPISRRDVGVVQSIIRPAELIQNLPIKPDDAWALSRGNLYKPLRSKDLKEAALDAQSWNRVAQWLEDVQKLRLCAG